MVTSRRYLPDIPVDYARSGGGNLSGPLRRLNLDHSFRNPKKDGSKKKPGKVWAYLEYNPAVRDQSRLPLLKAEREHHQQIPR
ncbi:MAG TPA: hypothetical protein VE178_10585 [Silvibacterium sp.]|nr:hypothetical protein [Silvibacterium sp.]